MYLTTDPALRQRSISLNPLNRARARFTNTNHEHDQRKNAPLAVPARLRLLVFSFHRDYQHGAGRLSHYFFRDTAHQHSGKPAATVGRHYDNVDGVILCPINDQIVRFARLDNFLDHDIRHRRRQVSCYEVVKQLRVALAQMTQLLFDL